MKFVTVEGHSFHLAPDPRGITMLVLPNAPVLNPDVLDTFQMGINYSNLARALKEMDSVDGFRGPGWDCCLRREDETIILRFSYKHGAKLFFETRLSKEDSRALVQVFQDCLNGKAHVDAVIPHPDPDTKVRRNEKCPCGSGLKFKKCCGSATRQPTLPLELKAFSAIEDPAVRRLLDEATRQPQALYDPGFWAYFGRELGTTGEYSLALLAHQRATELDPNNDAISADYATSLSFAGRHQESLEKLLSLPNPNGRFSVLIGNALCELNRPLEAILHYEKAIEHEPEFPFIYKCLLQILKEADHPLYEYWLLRARRQLPKSPTISFAYCEWLISENRLGELAEAEWIDDLEYKPDQRVVGRNQGEPKLILEMQILRLIARCLPTLDASHLENAQKVLDAAPPTWNLCTSAGQLAFAAGSCGRRDLVWKASRRICERCLTGPAGRVRVQKYLAQAASVAGDFLTAVQDIELGLKDAPQECDLLSHYWWALDEVDRSPEALIVARRLHESGVRYPDFCYNVGYIAGKVRQPDSAIKFYEEALRERPDHYLSLENLAYLKLIEGDAAMARLYVDRWTEPASKHLSAALLEAKSEKFRQLAVFVEGYKGCYLFLDVALLNKKTEPFFGAELKVPEERPTLKQLIAELPQCAPHRIDELSYVIKMEDRKDHSVLVARLEQDLPAIRTLPGNAIRSLVEGQAQLDETPRADFSPCCVALCKGVEISLVDQVLGAFRDTIKDDPHREQMMKQAADPEFEKANTFTRFIFRDAHIELGSMAFAFNLCRGNTGKNLAVLASFREWLHDNGFAPLLNEGFADKLGNLAKSFRNPAAHTVTHNREAALEVKARCLALLNEAFAEHFEQ